MNKAMKNILKILLIGLVTTIVRIIGQLSIPAGEQAVLAPSVFTRNGTMPLAFTIYGIFAYSLIASLFLLIQSRLGGNRILQGLKYGLSCCAVWIVYLLEPLPHVATIDRITYPVADSLALIVMGLLLGVDLVLFNFFMPLVFDADIPDLILRTFIDILAVTAGCLAFPNQRKSNPSDRR